MKQVFDVEGMSCNHCAKAVTKAVQQLDPQWDRDAGRDDPILPRLAVTPADAFEVLWFRAHVSILS